MGVESIVSSATQVDPQFWLNAATRAIRAECGWHVAPIITETIVLDGAGGTTLLVPSLRVRSITELTIDGIESDPDSVRFSRRSGVLTRREGWPTDVGSIELKLTHGFELAEVDDVAALIVALTKRASSAWSAGNVVAQGIGGASVRRGTGKDGGMISLPLLESEREALAPYQVSWGP